MANWYDFKITQGHPPDDGIDIGTPDRPHTPVSFPFGCDVIDSSYHVYGGQVVCATPGTDYSQYFIHLNNVFVQRGQSVQPGQIVGDTGGGVGDLLLHNGLVQPAQSQSWYQGHSSGPHTEYGIFLGQDMAQFNKGWSNPGRQLDPTAVYDALHNGQAPAWPGNGSPSGTTTAAIGAGGYNGVDWPGIVFPWLQPAANAARQALTPQATDIAQGLSRAAGSVMDGTAQSLGAKNFADGVRRIGFMGLAVTVMGLGALVFLAPYLKAAVVEVKSQIDSAASTAEKAAGAAVAA